jgi:hypothetical protein
MWVYIGDEDHPYNICDFSLGRNREEPINFLGDYNQVLLADGYAGYNGVVTGNALTRADCWLHLKRRFVKVERTAPEIALAMVESVRALYAVEHSAKAMKTAKRLTLHQEKSAPIGTIAGPPTACAPSSFHSSVAVPFVSFQMLSPVSVAETYKR